ncbi:aminotransferase class IV [Nocardioides sp.]|uniref:aminotransferase class IV n=1 Tax=Nocardioides sp. TaxID=35761 RepID=UPI002CD99FD3|nr:aminotransferase class IV [Nocardioides sp.]HSX67094.1 aminotransferase class IV [Nocardioides sp.]
MQATQIEGVFTTVKVVDGRPEHLGLHIARLAESAGIVGLGTPDPAAVRRVVAAALEAAPLPLGRLRITWQGTEAAATVDPQAPHPDTTSVIRARAARDPQEPTVGAKTEALGAQGRGLVAWARAQGVGDTVLATTDGRLCEGATSNVFYVVEGELRTPTLSTGLLNGITRQLLLAAIDVHEADASYEVLHRADEIFLTSSLRGVQAVTVVDGRPVGSRPTGGPGPVTLAAARSLAALPTDD